MGGYSKKILLILLGFSVILWGPISCSKEEKAPKVPLAKKAISVETLTATAQTLPEFKAFSGTVVPKVQVKLASKAPGFVKEVLVKEAQLVEAGQVLIHLDDKDLRWQIDGLEKKRNALERERAALQQDYSYAKSNFERVERLFKDEAATKDEYDRAKASFLAARERINAFDAQIEGVAAQINALRHELTYRVIKSPTTGWVTKRLVDPGTFVGPGVPLLEITSKKDGFWLEAHIPESMLDKVHPGDRAYALINGAENGLVKARIAQVVPEVDPSTRTFKVKADLLGKGYKSGMYGTLWLESGSRTGILLPDSVVMSRGGLKGVYATDQDGTIYFQVITIGGCYYRSEEGLIPCAQGYYSGAPAGLKRLLLLSSGVTPGMEICTSRLQEIKEGMSLE